MVGRFKAAIAVIAVIMLIVAAASPLIAPAQTLSAAKIVSVVFDDSGSMSGNANWAYANYAMQAFRGLLNKEDKLYITYMSDYTNPIEFDLTGDTQKQVDKIRGHFEAAGTPIEAVETAMNKLESVSNSNPNTKYWLVIITDGAFYHADDKDQNGIPVTALNNMMSSFVDKKMPNGANPQITYLAIGESAIKPAADNQKGIFVYPQTNGIVGGDEIVSVMSGIADMVSGRLRVPGTHIRFADDSAVEVTSDLPMFNIAVLSQKTSARVTGAASADATLKPVQSARLLYPDVQGFETDTSLKGAAALYNNGSVNIPSGTYTFKFSEPVSRDSVVFMYEPAIEARIKVYYPDGREVTDMKSLYTGNQVDIVCKIFESGADKEIDAGQLSGGVTYNVSYLEEGRLIAEDKSSALTIRGVTLKDIDSEIKASIEIPGFLPLTNTVDFRPVNPVVYTMAAIAPDGAAVGRASLYDNEKGLLFTVYADGAPMTKAELEGMDVHFTLEAPFAGRLAVETVLNDDGAYTCVPKYECWSFPAKWFWNWTSVWLPTGMLTITGGIGGGAFKELAQGAMQVEKENMLLTIFFYLFPFIVMFVLLGLLCKRRFKRRTRAKYINAQNSGTMFVSSGAAWSVRKLRAFTPWSLVPWLPQRRRVAGVVFYARPRGAIGVKISKVWAESRHLNPNSVDDSQMVKLPAAELRPPFVPAKKEERVGFEEFDIGDVLMLAANPRACTFIKLIGGR